MTKFRDTNQGAAFVASAATRETSIEIMEAIAFFARDKAEAEALWNGDEIGQIAHLTDIWERVTGNGRREATEFVWGAAGLNWYAEMSVAAASDA